MVFTNSISRFAAGLVVFMLVQTGVYAEAAKPPGKITYEDRVQFVETLIYKSSAAKQIDSSANPEAIAHRDLAKSHFEKAKNAHAAGNSELANEELVKASKTMFEAVRMAEKETFTAHKKKKDYQDRLDSVNALMEAHDRVSDEKGQQADGKELRTIVREKIQTANTHMQNEEYDLARSALDEAYVAAKISINSLRGGDTLVRSLNFETKEDEYHYEIDRNDTHKMLLKILSKDGEGGPKPGSMASEFMEEAEKLRNQAEKEASEGKHEQAIKTLEESTKNLVRALRGSGIYIPG